MGRASQASSKVQRESYFGIPVRSGLDETATSGTKVGDIGFWPPGNAMAIFFGPTPLTSGADPVPASAVCLIGADH